MPILELRPTQMTIGQREVTWRKRKLEKKYEKLDEEEFKEFLKEKAADVIIGPGGKVYIVDGHHHTRALLETDYNWTYVRVEKDWSSLSEEEFARRMQGPHRGRPYVWLRDENGIQRCFADLPRDISKLKDDPLRSIVFYLTRLKIIQKNENFPWFGEYRIVEWLRPQLKLKDDYGRWRIWNAAKEAAYLVSRWSSQKEHLPGQRYLTQERCGKKLGKLSKYYVQR